MLVTDKAGKKWGSGICFFCGNKIGEPPYIFWQGGDGKDIALHCPCASALIGGLLADGGEHLGYLKKQGGFRGHKWN